MYYRVINHYPVPFKINELRTALEERVNLENSSGARTALMMELMGQEQVLMHVVQHESFAAWEDHSARITTSEQFRAQGPKLQAVMSRPQTVELYATLARMATDRATNYLWTTTFYAAPGKVVELRGLLEERANTATDRGASTASLLSRRFAPEGGSLSLAYTFPDLASLEALQTGQQSDPGFASWGAKVESVVGRPNSQRLARILVPFSAS